MVRKCSVYRKLHIDIAVGLAMLGLYHRTLIEKGFQSETNVLSDSILTQSTKTRAKSSIYRAESNLVTLCIHLYNKDLWA